MHRTHNKPVSCLDFSANGSTLVASSSDPQVAVYDALEGVQRATVPMRKYGAGVVRFLRGEHPPSIVVASTLVDHKVRLLDLDRENYIRYFPGHQAQVSSITASPAGPEFISASRDAWVRVWDSRQEGAIGKVRATGSPIVAYDPKGLIFSIAYNASPLKTVVKLYDARQFEDGPFLEFSLENPSDSVPTCFKFSSDGEYFILVNADVDATVSVYDAYKGKCFRRFRGHRSASGVSLEASFSPDSAFVSSGSDDGSVFVWDLQSQEVLLQQKQVHALPSVCTVWNPMYQMLASACQNVLFWLPQEHDSSPEY